MKTEHICIWILKNISIYVNLIKEKCEKGKIAHLSKVSQSKNTMTSEKPSGATLRK